VPPRALRAAAQRRRLREFAWGKGRNTRPAQRDARPVATFGARRMRRKTKTVYINGVTTGSASTWEEVAAFLTGAY